MKQRCVENTEAAGVETKFLRFFWEAEPVCLPPLPFVVPIYWSKTTFYQRVFVFFYRLATFYFERILQALTGPGPVQLKGSVGLQELLKLAVGTRR